MVECHTPIRVDIRNQIISNVSSDWGVALSKIFEIEIHPKQPKRQKIQYKVRKHQTIPFSYDYDNAEVDLKAPYIQILIIRIKFCFLHISVVEGQTKKLTTGICRL